MGIIGFVYLMLFNYVGVQPLFIDQWTNTSVVAVLYIVPIMMIFVKKINIHNKLLELLGRGSFNICLVQMLYYWTAIPSRIYLIIPSIVLRLLSNVLICSIVGVVFYRIENPITQRIIKSIRNKSCT